MARQAYKVLPVSLARPALMAKPESKVRPAQLVPPAFREILVLTDYKARLELTARQVYRARQEPREIRASKVKLAFKGILVLTVRLGSRAQPGCKVAQACRVQRGLMVKLVCRGLQE